MSGFKVEKWTVSFTSLIADVSLQSDLNIKRSKSYVKSTTDTQPNVKRSKSYVKLITDDH